VSQNAASMLYVKKDTQLDKKFGLAAISRNVKVITFMNDVLKSDDQFIEDIARQGDADCLVEFHLLVDRLAENTILNIVKIINVRISQDQSYRKNINQIFSKIPIAISQYLFSKYSHKDSKRGQIEKLLTCFRK
jgi:hypothetical protein